jgi:hypothetical protein
MGLNIFQTEAIGVLNIKYSLVRGVYRHTDILSSKSGVLEKHP